MRYKEPGKETAILHAAIKVFAEQGYHKAQISRIAEHAGVATGTVYLYFGNKRDILLKIFGEMWAVVAKQWAAIANDTGLTAEGRLDALIDVVFDVCAPQPELAILLANEHSLLLHNHREIFPKEYDQALEIAQKIIIDGVTKGVFDKDADLTFLRHFIIGGMREALHQWSINPKEIQLGDIRRHAKRTLKHGILSH